MHLPSPDWLAHILTVDGPADHLMAFSRAVAGPGFIPWDIDYQRLEEDWYYRLVENQRAQPSRHRLSLPAARRLALMIREATWLLHEADPPPHCLFDLNRVIPVPSPILGLGVTHPDAIDWLWAHWGTTWPLRHVRQAVRTGSYAPYAIEFFAADWSPWPAIATLRQQFPSLTINLEVRY